MNEHMEMKVSGDGEACVWLSVGKPSCTSQESQGMIWGPCILG